MAETWELGLEKLSKQNIINFIEMASGKQKSIKLNKKNLLKVLYGLLDEAFIEAKITQHNKTK